VGLIPSPSKKRGRANFLRTEARCYSRLGSNSQRSAERRKRGDSKEKNTRRITSPNNTVAGRASTFEIDREFRRNTPGGGGKRVLSLGTLNLGRRGEYMGNLKNIRTSGE